MSSWFPFRRSSGFSSSDPDDAGKNVRWLEAALKDDLAWLDGVEAKADIDAQTEIAKEELKEWVFEAEDVLDEWKFQLLRAAVEPPPAPMFGRRYARDRDPLADLLIDPSFGRRVGELKERRVEIGEFNRMLRLGKAQGPRRYATNVEPPPTSSLLGEQHIYGREDDKEILVKFLLTGAMEESWNVVPIVGAAGVGKTTLLQLIYNDPAVSKHFGNLRKWVSARKGLQMVELMKKIGECLTEKSCNYHQLGVVQDLLKKQVNGERFLLVLDDLWFETVHGDQWKNLHAACDGCASGSVIILTTQDERVAEQGRCPTICWNLCQGIFVGRCSRNMLLVLCLLIAGWWILERRLLRNAKGHLWLPRRLESDYAMNVMQRSGKNSCREICGMKLCRS